MSVASLGIGSLVFSRTQYGIRGPCAVLYDRARLFGNNTFAPKMGKKRPSLGFFECIGKFSFFFHSLAYYESLY